MIEYPLGTFLKCYLHKLAAVQVQNLFLWEAEFSLSVLAALHKHGGSSALKATLPQLRQALTHQTELAEDYSFFTLKTINFYFPCTAVSCNCVFILQGRSFC